MENEYKKHPSYATLKISRSFCSGRQTLFGSSIKHSDVITLKISPASISRNLNNDHIYSENSPYIEINMSEAQFAQAITSFNMGEGTPVTLKQFNGEYIEQCPFQDKRMQFDNEFSEDMRKLVKELKEISKEAEDILENKKTLSKGDREKILSALEKVQTELGSNLPFVFSQFNKQMEKTVTEAKAEIEGHIQARLNDMAMRGMQIESGEEHMPEIEEANITYAEDNIEENMLEIEDTGMQMGGM